MKTYNLKEGSIWEREDGATAVGRVEGDWTVEFGEKFSLSFFATEDWNYDFKNNPSEFQFKSWQEKNTNIAKTKQEMLKSFIRSLLNTRMEQHDQEVRRLQREEIKEHLPYITADRYKIIDEDKAYCDAINDVKDLLDSSSSGENK